MRRTGIFPSPTSLSPLFFLQVFDYPSIRDITEYLATNYSTTTRTPTADHLGVESLAAPQDAAVTAAATALVSAAVHELLGTATPVDPSAPLMTAGLNSTTAVALAAALETATGNSLPPTLVRDEGDLLVLVCAAAAAVESSPCVLCACGFCGGCCAQHQVLIVAHA